MVGSSTVVEVPESVFVIMVPSPPLDEEPEARAWWPLVVDLCGAGAGGYLLTFGDRQGVEEFLESPAMDVAGVAREVPFARLADVLDVHLEHGRAEYVVVDPSPPHEWGSGDERGGVLRIEELVEALRAEFAGDG